MAFYGKADPINSGIFLYSWTDFVFSCSLW